MMSISPADGQFERSMVPDVPAPLDRKPAPSIQNAGRLPTPLEGLGCLMEAVTSISSQPKKGRDSSPFRPRSGPVPGPVPGPIPVPARAGRPSGGGQEVGDGLAEDGGMAVDVGLLGDG